MKAMRQRFGYHPPQVEASRPPRSAGRRLPLPFSAQKSALTRYKQSGPRKKIERTRGELPTLPQIERKPRLPRRGRSDVQRFVFFLSLNSFLEQFGNHFVYALVSINGRHIFKFGPILSKYPSGPPIHWQCAQTAKKSRELPRGGRWDGGGSHLDTPTMRTCTV